MAETKIDRLTPPQSAALTQVLAGEIQAGTVAVKATVATFALSPAEALTLVTRAQSAAGELHGRQGHPYQSLHAVVRKLSAAAQ